MSVEVFNWSPLADPTADTKFKVFKAQFGDGYAQVVRDGFNNVVSTWPLTFAGNETEITPILDFFDRHKGDKAFFWTPSLSPQKLFRVEGYTLQPGAGLNHFVVTATFMEVFRP